MEASSFTKRVAEIMEKMKKENEKFFPAQSLPAEVSSKGNQRGLWEIEDGINKISDKIRKQPGPESMGDSALRRRKEDETPGRNEGIGMVGKSVMMVT